MSVNHTKMVNKLQTALLRQYGVIIFVDKEQFYSTEQDRLISMYILYQRVYNEEKHRYEKKQLLKTADNVSILRYVIKMYKDLEATQKELGGDANV